MSAILGDSLCLFFCTKCTFIKFYYVQLMCGSGHMCCRVFYTLYFVTVYFPQLWLCSGHLVLETRLGSGCGFPYPSNQRDKLGVFL